MMMHIDTMTQFGYKPSWGCVMQRKDYPTQSELKSLFYYNKNNGKLYNKYYRSSRALKGQEAGCITKKGYVQVRINYQGYFAHDLIWIMEYGDIPCQMIDHKNNINFDNRLENLRIADDCQNQYNRKAPKNNTSGYKGVSWCKQTNSWQAAIQISGKKKHLGRFKNKENAYEAYCCAAKNGHKDFARI